MARLAQLVLITFALALAGCSTAYYAAWEKLGVEKRDLLVDRVEDAQEAQEDGKEQFATALEQFKSVVEFDGGDLEDYYDSLNSELENSQEAAEEITGRINDVEDVAEDLFKEWENELDQYTNANFRRDSAAKLNETRSQYQRLITSMRRAESSIEPVLAVLNDNVLYLKHNLNARAIASLKGELATVNQNVDKLMSNMQAAIDESNSFIQSLNN